MKFKDLLLSLAAIIIFVAAYSNLQLQNKISDLEIEKMMITSNYNECVNEMIKR